MKNHSPENHIMDDNVFFLKERGYLHVRSFFDKSFVLELAHKIKTRINQCAQELSCSYEDYLQSASRWVEPSPVTIGMKEIVFSPLKSYLENFIGDGELVKLNVISKTPFSPSPLPLHQDISYSPESPYQLSVWLALTDAPIESGPMEVIIGSHRGDIEPPVDFWSPDFKDQSYLQKGIRKELPAKAGDLILFDSCLWHGSGQNNSSNERFALVTRWKEKGYSPPIIPTADPKPFGICTCQRKTEEILRKAQEFLFGETSSDYLTLLKYWEEYLESPQQAKEDLKRVRLLHLAHEKHNGGDAQGVLYARLWQSLLEPLLRNLDPQWRGEDD